MRGLRTRATLVLSALMVALGVAVVAQTARAGGGIGYLLGALLMLAGGLRLYLSR